MNEEDEGHYILCKILIRYTHSVNAIGFLGKRLFFEIKMVIKKAFTLTMNIIILRFPPSIELIILK